MSKVVILTVILRSFFFFAVAQLLLSKKGVFAIEHIIIYKSLHKITFSFILILISRYMISHNTKNFHIIFVRDLGHIWGTTPSLSVKAMLKCCITFGAFILIENNFLSFWPSVWQTHINGESLRWMSVDDYLAGGLLAQQIGFLIVCSTVCSRAGQRNILWWPVDSLIKGQ